MGVKSLTPIEKKRYLLPDGSVSGGRSARVMLLGFSIRSKLAENRTCAIQDF